MYRPFRLPLIALFVAALFVDRARAQTGIEILQQQVEYVFNSSVHFSAQFQSPETMTGGYVFFQVGQEDHTWVYEGELGPQQTIDVQVKLDQANAPKAFSTVTYWFRLASDHGEFFESPRYMFYYEDNRYIWQQLESPPFTVRWHNGDLAFAEALLAAAQQGVLRAGELLPLPNPEPMTFQIYDNVQDVQLVAQLAGYSWVAGHSDPASSLILFSLVPGDQQSLEIQRQVPHEVAHLLLYQVLGPQAYSNLPVWLNEGFASNVEIYSDPLGEEMLQLAHKTNTILSLYSLCKAFPQDPASARLAYAMSNSFVRYLYERYNRAGLSLLLDAYAQGGDCMNAPLASFGKDLDHLEADWRQATFSLQWGLQAELESLPWSAIAAGGLISLALWALLRRLNRVRN